MDDWTRKIEEEAEWTRRYLAPLVGARIREVEVTPSGPYFWPRLKVVLPGGKEVLLKVDCDEEGNGPGFLFGLEHPGKSRDDSVAAQLEWAQKYLAPLVGGVVKKVDVEVDEDGAWPKLIVQLPDYAEDAELEVSRDEEGNGPGFLSGLERPAAAEESQGA